MSYANLRTKQKEQSERVARFIIARGKRSFFMKVPWIMGIGFWLVMNTLLLTYNHSGLRVLILACRESASGCEILAGCMLVNFLISMLFGFLISLSMWGHFKRLVKSDLLH
jgi:hypothetical protein